MVEYKSELDKFEVYNYQQTLSMIDKRGFAHVTEREQIRKLNYLSILSTPWLPLFTSTRFNVCIMFCRSKI